MRRLVASLICLCLCSAGCGSDSAFAFASGSRVVRIAESQIGKGEAGGDNRGAVVKGYTGGKEVAWCAGFVSWVLQRAGKGQPYILHARDYWTVYKGKRVGEPRPGDVIVFWRGSRSGGQGHVGIVERVTATQVVTIQGNVGEYPAKVKRIVYARGEIPRLLGFVRVP